MCYIAMVYRLITFVTIFLLLIQRAFVKTNLTLLCSTMLFISVRQSCNMVQELEFDPLGPACVENTFICDFCHRSFSAKQQLQLHLKTHSEGRFCCDFCKGKFASKVVLVKHLQSPHQEKKIQVS